MPTYEYECLACEAEFERFQSMSDKPVSVCPECGKRKVRRKIGGGAGILFKGSGFYCTDYRGSDYSSRAQADSPSAKDSTDSKKSEGKTGKKKTA